MFKWVGALQHFSVGFYWELVGVGVWGLRVWGQGLTIQAL